MTWLLVIGAGWLLLASLVAVVIGRSVRLADEKAAAIDAAVDEPNFVVDPVTPLRGRPDATVLPFAAPSGAEPPAREAPRGDRDAPTVPGIPVARPPAPGAGNAGGQVDPLRKTGLA